VLPRSYALGTRLLSAFTSVARSARRVPTVPPLGHAVIAAFRKPPLNPAGKEEMIGDLR
jgi:hypothetical protein